MLLAVYFDLMSHLAENYTRSVTAGLQHLQARTTVVAQLVHLQHNADLAPFHDIIHIPFSFTTPIHFLFLSLFIPFLDRNHWQILSILAVVG